MYEVNDIYYAGACENEITVTDAEVLAGNMMLITFSTGEKRLFDAANLKGSAFEPLKDENKLKDFKIFHGIVTWDEGKIDIAPETMYYESVAYNTVR